MAENPMKEMLGRAAKQAANYQYRIDAQKEMLTRLLDDRHMDKTDREVLDELIAERNKLRAANLGLQEKVDAVVRLIDVLEEGTQQINTDLVREALNG